MILMLQLSPEGHGKVQSCVGLRLMILSPLAFMDHCIATPNGVILAPGMSGTEEGKSGMAHCDLTSFWNALKRANLFAFRTVDWWLPRLRWNLMSSSLSFSEMSLSGYFAPWVMMFLIMSQFGWWSKSFWMF